MEENMKENKDRNKNWRILLSLKGWDWLLYLDTDFFFFSWYNKSLEFQGKTWSHYALQILCGLSSDRWE